MKGAFILALVAIFTISQGESFIPLCKIPADWVEEYNDFLNNFLSYDYDSDDIKSKFFFLLILYFSSLY